MSNATTQATEPKSNPLETRITFEEVHSDMKRYLAKDCYCPGEIYDISGFFYQIFKPEDQCIIIEKSDAKTAILADLDSEKPQAIMIWHDDDEQPDTIIAAQRVDGTENNIGILRTIVQGGKYGGRELDEFHPGDTAKSLDKVLSISDAIIVD